MAQHVTNEQLEQFRRRALAPRELLALDDHLAGCEDCRRLLLHEFPSQTMLDSLRAQLAASGEPAHLEYEQLAAYLDGSLDAAEREIAEGHFESCGQCRDELDDLAAFKSSLDLAETRAGATATASDDAPTRASMTADAASSQRTSLREKIQDFWNSVFRPTSFWLAAAASVACLLVVAAFAVWTARRHARAPEVAVTATPPATTAPPATPAPASPAAASPTPARNGQDRSIASNGNQPPPTGGATSSQSGPPKRNSSSRTNVPARTGASDQPSASVQPSAPPRAVVALNDGGQVIALDRRGQLSGLDALAPDERESVRRALEGRLEPSTSLAGLGGSAGALMGAAEEGKSFSLLTPVATVVRGERPTFRWQPLEGAAGYAVEVYDADYNKVAVSPPLSSHEWTAAQPLKRGALYSWQVVASKDGRETRAPAPPAPEAKFRVLDEKSSDKLARAERSASSHLARGTLYARAGLLDDAEREFKALADENPRSELAKRLLLDVQRMRQPKR